MARKFKDLRDDLADRVGEQRLATAEQAERDRYSRLPVPLLNAEQAGELLNVPPSWVLAEARANRIPSVRLGKYVRFDAEDLRVWRDARKQGPVRRREES